ncbi:hypothetical protein [Alcaligenes sp. SDU_A2]|uniref:hypothetical protein n=1 Tax=Alcaligenes sp. SDU_A2 TaxID=3136634 RepID=UPI00311E4070
MPNELYRFYIGGSLAGVPIYASWTSHSPLPANLHGLQEEQEYALTRVELSTPQGGHWHWQAYCSHGVSQEQARFEIQQYILRRMRDQNHA